MTPAETRAATLAKLRERPDFAAAWSFYEMNPALNFEMLVCIAYEIGRGHGIDQARAVLGKLREATP